MQYCEKSAGTPCKSSNYDLGFREDQNFPCLQFHRKKKNVESQICVLQETPILSFAPFLTICRSNYPTDSNS